MVAGGGLEERANYCRNYSSAGKCDWEDIRQGTLVQGGPDSVHNENTVKQGSVSKCFSEDLRLAICQNRNPVLKVDAGAGKGRLGAAVLEVIRIDLVDLERRAD